jgi:hypothetical protein
MTKKIFGIVDRVIKRKAVGIIYNVPKIDEALLQNRLLDEHKVLPIKGRDAYTHSMLLHRLSSKLKIKHIQFSMIPALIDDKIIMITGADMIKNSYNRILDESYKYKIPLLIIMNNETAMKDFRKFAAYQRVFTIEQNYKTL